MSQFRPLPPADTPQDPAVIDPPTETSSQPAFDGVSLAGRTIANGPALMDRARDGFSRAKEALDLAAMRAGEW
ncbi:MAG TPA: hypothetical protein VH372_18680 [Actinospica sp.]|jgi:hypothetical protein|nr:hypothetical protein [Actinospica sp.]